MAWLAVLGWHAAVGWWLLRSASPLTGDGNRPALQVVYVTLPAPWRRAHAAPTRRVARAVRPSSRQRSHRPAATTTPAPDALPVQVPAPRSLLDQASAYARLSERTPPRRVDPLADRPQRLPEDDRGRFRMREAITPARAVAWTARHVFAPMIPRGYDPDPCPRNRENIADLATAGDGAALAGELDFERRHCRP